MVDARPVAPFSHHRDGNRAVDAPEGLQGVDNRSQPPGVALVFACMVEALEALSGLRHSPDRRLADDRRRRGRPDHFPEPTPVGWAPGRPAGIAQIVAPHAGVEAPLGGLKIASGLFPSPAQVADGFIFHRGDIDGCEST